MWREVTRSLFILIAAATLAAAPATAADLHVGPGQPYATIQAAVDAAVAGDVVSVHAGTYVENVVVDRRITLRSDEFFRRGDNTTVVIDASEMGQEHGIVVLATGASVRGFSIFGAVGNRPDGFRSAILVEDADGVRVEHNRCGWHEDYHNSLGITFRRTSHSVIAGNEAAEGSGALMLQDAIGAAVFGNHFHDNTQDINAFGIYALHNDWVSNHDNLISNNVLEGNSVGMRMDGAFRLNTIQSNVISGNYNGLIGWVGSSANVIANNTFEDNGMAGIRLVGSYNNTVSGNLLDNNHRGIWLGYQSPSDWGGRDNVVIGNTIINHAYTGMEISPNSSGNRMFLNTFAGNLHNVLSWGTDWSTPFPVSYWHGANWSGPLGNYYDTYTGTDLDGDGIGDTDLPFEDGDAVSGPSEMHPLVDPPEHYQVQAWFMDGEVSPVMHRRDLTLPLGLRTVDGGASVLWTSDEPAGSAVTFAAAPWTGQVAFNNPPAFDTFVVEVGSSAGGGDFTPGGAQATVGGEFASIFATSAAVFTVPAGHHLAVRLTNTTGSAYDIVTGGTATCLSSPGSDDPLWPSGWTSGVPDAAAGPGVRLAQNHPNPFNPSTIIAFELDTSSTVDLRVYDVSGRLVRTLLHCAPFGKGAHRTPWTGRDDQGRQVAAGVYFYRLEAAGRVLTRPMVLVK